MGSAGNTEHLGLSLDLSSLQTCLGGPFSLIPTSTHSHTGSVPGAGGLVTFVRIPWLGAPELHTSGHSSTTTEHLNHLILLNFSSFMHKTGLKNGPFTLQPLSQQTAAIFSHLLQEAYGLVEKHTICDAKLSRCGKVLPLLLNS